MEFENFERAAYNSSAYTNSNNISCISGHTLHKWAQVQLQTAASVV